MNNFGCVKVTIDPASLVLRRMLRIIMADKVSAGKALRMMCSRVSGANGI